MTEPWTLERLLAGTTYDPVRGCRTLPPASGRKGYATVSIGGGRVARAHRVCFEVVYGPIPAGHVVMHSCDVRNCIEPSHLSAATVLANNADRDEKQRQPRGETHGAHVLTEDDVRRILALAADGRTQASLAREYRVSGVSIHRIVRGKRWAHVVAGISAAA